MGNLGCSERERERERVTGLGGRGRDASSEACRNEPNGGRGVFASVWLGMEAARESTGEVLQAWRRYCFKLPGGKVVIIDLSIMLSSINCGTVRESGRLGLGCLLYTSPSPRDISLSRMPSSA